MVSAPFSLGPGDTLILGGNGYYTFNPNGQFTEKRFCVNLITKSNNEIFRTLFYDTVAVADTIESEYLRGYIFTEHDLPSADSFYVQLVIDQSSLAQCDQNYSICNVYSQDELFEGGDNPHAYKRKIFFQNGNKMQNNISNIPKIYALSQNYPNPFNPVTNIKYQLPKDGLVNLKVYDLLGREIKNIVNEYQKAGYYSYNFNGSNLASGIYFYRIEAGSFVSVKRMVLIK